MPFERSEEKKHAKENTKRRKLTPEEFGPKRDAQRQAGGPENVKAVIGVQIISKGVAPAKVWSKYRLVATLFAM
jgi:hypothetical protein